MSTSRKPLTWGLVVLAAAFMVGTLLLSVTGGSAARLEVRVVAPLQVFVFDDIELAEAPSGADE